MRRRIPRNRERAEPPVLPPLTGTPKEFFDAMVTRDMRIIRNYIRIGGDVNVTQMNEEGKEEAAVVHLINNLEDTPTSMNYLMELLVKAGLDVHTKDVDGTDLLTLIFTRTTQPRLALPLLDKDESLGRVKGKNGENLLHILAMECGSNEDVSFKAECAQLAGILNLVCEVDNQEKDDNGMRPCDALDMAEKNCECDDEDQNVEDDLKMREVLDCAVDDDNDNHSNSKFPLIPPSPQLETIEWSESLPEVFDPVMYDNVEAKEFLDADANNVVFIDASGKSALGFEKESLKKFTEKLYYECKKQNKFMTVPLDLIEDVPYVILPGQLSYYVHAEQLMSVIQSDDRIFVMISDRKMNHTTSIGSIDIRGDGRDYQRHQINVVSADHCQEGSDKMLYTIKVAKIVTKPASVTMPRRSTRQRVSTKKGGATGRKLRLRRRRSSH